MTTKTKSKIDTERLKRLADMIQPFERGGDMTELVHRLETEEKAKIPEGNGHTTVNLAGITKKSPRGLAPALKLWAQKARRVVLAEGQ